MFGPGGPNMDHPHLHFATMLCITLTATKFQSIRSEVNAFKFWSPFDRWFVHNESLKNSSFGRLFFIDLANAAFWTLLNHRLQNQCGQVQTCPRG